MEIDYGEVLTGGVLFLFWYLVWYLYKYLRKGKGPKMPAIVFFLVFFPILVFLGGATYFALWFYLWK